MSRAPEPQRGITLTEVTIVMILAAMIMTGLVAFYLNSQATWMDGSSQALTQREANLVLESIRRHARGATIVVVSPSPDADHAQIDLMPFAGAPADSTYSFWWMADSTLHEGHFGVPGGDRGAMTASPVITFRVAADAELVYIRSLQLQTLQHHVVTTGTVVRLMNGNS